MPAPVELDSAIERFLSRPLGDPAPAGELMQRARRRRRRRRMGVVVCGALVASLSVTGAARVLSTHDDKLDVATRRSTPPTAATIRVARLPLAPSPRINATSAFDEARGTVVLFGGSGPYGSLDDTWTWDGSRWHEQHARTRPPARSGATMAYDPASHEVLMTGGEAAVPLTDPCQRSARKPPSCRPPALLRTVPLAGDLWSWNGRDWKRLLAEADQPRPIAMATDDRNGRVVMLRHSGSVLDTFTWSGPAWVYRRPSQTPVSADAVGIAFDASVDRVVAIESYQPGVCMPHSGCTKPARTISATWDGNFWSASDTAGAPSLGAGLLDPTSLVSDPFGRGMIAFDAHGNTWQRKGERWTRVATAAQSPVRQAMTIVTDPVHHQVIAFGGYVFSRKMPTAFPGTNETWIWNGSTWERRTAPLGEAKPPPAPAPQACTLNGPALVPGTPRSEGTSLRISISDLFGVSPCHLTVSLRLVLVDSAGRPLAVEGNPAPANFDADVTGTGTSVLEGGWTWTNPCAPPGGARAQITATGRGALPDPFTIDVPAPTCSNQPPSRLTADPLTVRE
jgi:hypothetical protein